MSEFNDAGFGEYEEHDDLWLDALLDSVSAELEFDDSAQDAALEETLVELRSLLLDVEVPAPSAELAEFLVDGHNHAADFGAVASIDIDPALDEVAVEMHLADFDANEMLRQFATPGAVAEARRHGRFAWWGTLAGAAAACVICVGLVGTAATRGSTVIGERSTVAAAPAAAITEAAETIADGVQSFTVEAAEAVEADDASVAASPGVAVGDESVPVESSRPVVTTAADAAPEDDGETPAFDAAAVEAAAVEEPAVEALQSQIQAAAPPPVAEMPATQVPVTEAPVAPALADEVLSLVTETAPVERVDLEVEPVSSGTTPVEPAISPVTVTDPAPMIIAPVEPASSVVDAPAPVVETPAPVVETPAPVVDAPAPVVEAPAPVVEAPAPVVETPAPVVETPAPVVETPAPVVETPAPVVETPAPVDPAPGVEPSGETPALPGAELLADPGDPVEPEAVDLISGSGLSKPGAGTEEADGPEVPSDDGLYDLLTG